MRKPRPRKAFRERNKIRCIYCKNELLDAIEKIDGVCYFCINNPKRRERYKMQTVESGIEVEYKSFYYKVEK